MKLALTKIGKMSFFSKICHYEIPNALSGKAIKSLIHEMRAFISVALEAAEGIRFTKKHSKLLSIQRR